MSELHPKPHYSGSMVTILRPCVGSSFSAWRTQASVLTVIPEGTIPEEINGIAVSPWQEAPLSDADWEMYAAHRGVVSEPDFTLPERLNPAAGAVILEPDNRVWLVHPTNQYAGYTATFPKGSVDAGCSLQTTALKECFEEAGLKVRILGWLGDYPRTSSYTRYYLAERVGGSPAEMSWESQAVSLVHLDILQQIATSAFDEPVINDLRRYLCELAVSKPEAGRV